MYILCDVNSMYASCEKVFDPAIRNRPVVVLTNNDGCVCAACGIAKKMGVGKKFVPYFKVRHELQQAGAVIRSSNYELYADLSQRFIDTCIRFAPHSHVYSIDELFLYYGKHNRYVPAEGWQQHAADIRRTVWREVRLPIGVGAGSTPTLAKAASHAAKRIDGYRGVAVIDNEATRQHILSAMPVNDVWGIGRKISKKLQVLNIKTAWQLANTNSKWLKQQFSILVADTVDELNGLVRVSWDQERAAKKEIYSSRSFGQRIRDKDQLKYALATHASIAANKLRKQDSRCKAMVIFASNSPHDAEGYYRQSVFHQFPVASHDSRLFIAACRAAVEKIFKSNVRFYRCGVGLVDISADSNHQKDLFTLSQDNTPLMQCMDSINKRYGRDTVQLAGQGVEQAFAMRRQFLSPQYTTQWQDIPRIECC